MVFDCCVWFKKIIKRSKLNLSQSLFVFLQSSLYLSFFLSQSSLSSLLDQQSRAGHLSVLLARFSQPAQQPSQSILRPIFLFQHVPVRHD
jgi:hypothetical protein